MYSINTAYVQSWTSLTSRERNKEGTRRAGMRNLQDMINIWQIQFTGYVALWWNRSKMTGKTKEDVAQYIPGGHDSNGYLSEWNQEVGNQLDGVFEEVCPCAEGVRGINNQEPF